MKRLLLVAACVVASSPAWAQVPVTGGPCTAFVRTGAVTGEFAPGGRFLYRVPIANHGATSVHVVPVPLRAASLPGYRDERPPSTEGALRSGEVRSFPVFSATVFLAGNDLLGLMEVRCR